MSWRTKIGALSGALIVSGLLLGPAAQAAAPVQLTGTQLRAALLPASYFPPGYKVQKNGNYTSGSRLEHAPARYHLAAFSCQHYLIYSLPNTGFGETAAAGDIIAVKTAAFSQSVYQFATPAQAATFYQQFYAFTGRCRSITASYQGTAVRLTTQSISRTHMGRYPAFRAQQTESATGLGATINDTTTTLAGTDVYVLDAFGHNKAPTTPTGPAALLALIARVHAAR
jgi:hypothetical protein